MRTLVVYAYYCLLIFAVSVVENFAKSRNIRGKVRFTIKHHYIMIVSSSCNSVFESNANVNLDSKNYSITNNRNKRCNKKAVKTTVFATRASNVIRRSHAS